MVTQYTRPSAELPDDAVSELSESLQGDVITPQSPEYEEARHVWNASIDRRPVVIVRPRNTAGVIQAVNFAREHGLQVAIRGGGHGIGGFGVVDGGMVIHMGHFKGIEVNPETHTAKVQGGVLGKELGQAASQHGLALPLGTVPTTGVTGVLLGGGIGWLTRTYGLSIDNLLSAEIVTADGQVLRASETDNPDLFWALRGGGGNFGVVTELEVQLQPAGIIVGGLLIHAIEDSATVLRSYRDFASVAPDRFNSMAMFMTLPPIPILPPALHGRKVLAIGVCYVGEIAEGQAMLAPLRAVGQPLADMISPMPFSVLQSLGEAGGMLGLQHDVRSAFLSELSDQAIDTALKYALEMRGSHTQAHIIQVGGAMSNVAAGATAFRHRDAKFMLAILPTWPDSSEADDQLTWMHSFAEEMKPFTSGTVYVNFVGIEGQERVRAAYGDNYGRLVELKQRYDPTNFFQLNQNIAPES